MDRDADAAEPVGVRSQLHKDVRLGATRRTQWVRPTPRVAKTSNFVNSKKPKNLWHAETLCPRWDTNYIPALGNLGNSRKHKQSGPGRCTGQ